MDEQKSMETEPDKSYLHHNPDLFSSTSMPSPHGVSDKLTSTSTPITHRGSDIEIDIHLNMSGGRNRSISSSCSNNNNNNNHCIVDNDVPMTRNGLVASGRSLDDTGIGLTSGSATPTSGSAGSRQIHPTAGGSRPSRACPSPISSIVGTALNQMHLKRSSSAPMINQLGVGLVGAENGGRCGSPVGGAQTSGSGGGDGGGSGSGGGGLPGSSGGGKGQESIADVDNASSYASSFLSSLGGPRPRRFSASFSPAGSPGPAPNRVSQLRQENASDWETTSEKEFHGTVNIAQSWEDLSLDSMSMEVGTRRPSISDQLWLSMPPSSAPSSPAASPRVLSRFSPSLSSPSPTRKSFTTRRSLSPIAVRPSVLAIGQQGVKRKCDWDSNGSSSSNQMDCSPQPAKRVANSNCGGLLSSCSYNTMAGSPVSQFSSPGGGGGSNSGHSSTGTGSGYPFSYSNTALHPQYFPGIAAPSSQNQSQHLQVIGHHHNSSTSTSSNSLMSMITNQVEQDSSPFSNESSVSSSIGGCDSPFFRPVDSPLAAGSVTTSPEDSPRPLNPKI